MTEPEMSLDYHGETENEFTKRCYTFIKNWFDRNDLKVYSSNRESFRIGFEERDGTLVDYFIDSYFNKKVIVFQAPLYYDIPDHKLVEVSEFINRLNSNLFIGSLYLNYEKRRVEARLVYHIGNKDLDDDSFEFYYNTLTAVKARKSIDKIIQKNENPALVAIDWPN
ncbi:hypothetical protein [Pedobacter rhizosphaerae]|nr:hypothetical protein [Pedobacter rhizosphaerae]